MNPAELESLVIKHTNQGVETRAREIEAFLLAQLRVRNLKPEFAELVERWSDDGRMITWTVEVRSTPRDYAVIRSRTW